MIPSLRSLSYHKLSLWFRRLRDDMIEVFTIIHRINKVYLGKFFIWMRIEGQEGMAYLKIKKNVNSNIGLNFFDKIYKLLESTHRCNSRLQIFGYI